MPLIINPSLQSGYCFNTSDISYCGGLVSWYLKSSHAPSFWDWVHEQQIKWTIIQETQRKAVERGLIIGSWYQIAMIMSFFYIVIQWSAMFLRFKYGERAVSSRYMGKNPELIFGAAKCEVCFSNDLAKKILCLRPLYWMTMHIFPFISIACCFCDTCAYSGNMVMSLCWWKINLPFSLP